MYTTTPSPTFAWERRARRALLDTMIPGQGSLPPMAEQDLDRFWDRFAQQAPPHLQMGLSAATWVLAGALPLLLGYGATLAELPPAERDAVLQRADRLSLLRPFVEVTKVVACFAYFDQPTIQHQVRTRTAAPHEPSHPPTQPIDGPPQGPSTEP
ncbi:MAG: hypothetical protein AAFX99_12620 [Myxococcota bacterium]